VLSAFRTDPKRLVSRLCADVPPIVNEAVFWLTSS
jgi:hypothetical protein